jgi:hypothetical protein
MRARLFDVVKENLCCPLTAKWVTPMKAFDTSIQNRITRPKAQSKTPVRSLDPNGPRPRRLETEANTQAYFTGFSVSMWGENVPTLVYAHIGVSGIKSEVCQALERPAQLPEKAFHFTIPIRARRVRDLPVAQRHEPKPGLCAGVAGQLGSA